MNASFWIKNDTVKLCVSDQPQVYEGGVWVEVYERDEAEYNRLVETAENPNNPSFSGHSILKQVVILTLSKSEARAFASAVMGAAAEL